MKSVLPRTVVNQAIRGLSGPDWSWDSGVLPDFDIWLIIEGEGGVTCDRGLYPLARGDCFFLRKGERYEAHQHKGSQLETYGIHVDFVDGDGRVTAPAWLPPFHRKLVNTNFVLSLAGRTVDSWRRFSPKSRDMQALQEWGRALFREIVSQDRRAEEAMDSWSGQRALMERIIAELEQDPAGAPSVAQMAEQLGCSRWTFSSVFKRHTGSTPHEYVLQRKIDHAKYLLETSTLTAQQIATRMKYSDASHFNKQFRRHVGMTPIAYRKRSRS